MDDGHWPGTRLDPGPPQIIEPPAPADLLSDATLLRDASEAKSKVSEAALGAHRAANRQARQLVQQTLVTTATSIRALRQAIEDLEKRLAAIPASETRITAEPHPAGQPFGMRVATWLLLGFAALGLCIPPYVTAQFLIEFRILGSVESIAFSMLFAVITVTGGVFGLSAFDSYLPTQAARRRFRLGIAAGSVSIAMPLWLMSLAGLAEIARSEDVLMGAPLDPSLADLRAIGAGVFVVAQLVGEILGGFLLKTLACGLYQSRFIQEVVPNVLHTDFATRLADTRAALIELERQQEGARAFANALDQAERGFEARCLLILERLRQRQRAIAVLALTSPWGKRLSIINTEGM